MKIRIYLHDNTTKDLDSVNSDVRIIQSINHGTRSSFVVGDIGGDVEFSRTGEIENGRVVFR